MSEDKINNPSAFPRSYSDNETDERRATEIWEAQKGMGLRDYFAGEALNGECAAQDNQSMGIAVNDVDYTNAAIRAYKFADAMLVQRNKSSSEGK